MTLAGDSSCFRKIGVRAPGPARATVRLIVMSPNRAGRLNLRRIYLHDDTGSMHKRCIPPPRHVRGRCNSDDRRNYGGTATPGEPRISGIGYAKTSTGPPRRAVGVSSRVESAGGGRTWPHQRLFRPDHSPARTSRAPRLYGVSAVRPSAVRLRRHTIGSRTDDTKRSAKSIRAPPRHRDSGGSRRADTWAWSLSSASALIPHTVRIILS